VPFASVRSVARWIAVLLSLACVAPAHAAVEEAIDVGGLRAVVWFDPAGEERRPVVVFSHGMYMCPTQSRYLMHALADAGYFVVAPRHADSNCAWSLPAWSRAGFKPSAMWTETDYRDRADDIRHLVTTLRTERRFRARIDVDRLGLAGHSLGGYTVLGLGGAWPSWKLGGVRAILAMTPYSLPFQRTSGLAKLTAPVMYQIGTLDPVFTVPIEITGGGYAQSPSPKYLVQVDGAAHLAWTDLGFSGRDAIVGYAIAFFDRHLKGAAPETMNALAQALPDAASFQQDLH
jgi:predicted dienelactone hydrolase